MTELVVVRHGRTEANASGLLLGRLDPSLDAVGREQAEAVAAAVGPVARLVSSPLRRATETAAAFGLPVEIDDRWIELDYGALDGRPIRDVDPEVWARWRADPDFVPAGGESLRDLAGRVATACDELLAAREAGPVVIVTHVSPVKAALAWSLGVGPEVSWRSWVAPGSVTRIGLQTTGAVLRTFNLAPDPPAA